ncbi:hypothetical protein [Paenibacillus harenae]|nr:hypothetical protein [Paenibacillus harenae]
MTRIAYRIKVGSWESKIQRPWIEAEYLKRKLSRHVRNVEIITEREVESD